MKNISLRVAAVLAALFITTGSILFGAAQENEILFTLLRGRAALLRATGGTWLDLGPQPIAVKFGNSLRTDAESRGELKFPDGSLFRLKSNTVLTILNGGAQLQVGETWFQLKKQMRAFQIVTPTAVCIVMGTTLDVNVDRFGKTLVRVFEGMVSVKANQDSRRRQVVLQKGMATTVKDRTVTENRIEKFDLRQTEQRANEEWNTSSAALVRFGPEHPVISTRTSLPPIRPALPTPLKVVTPDVTVPSAGKAFAPSRFDRHEMDGHGKESDGEPGIRDTIEFFENLHHGIVKNRPLRPGTFEARAAERDEELSKSGETGVASVSADSSTRNVLPPNVGAIPGPANRAPLMPDQLQEGHGRPFGRSGPGPLGIQDQRQLRDEISQNEEQIIRVIEQIRTSNDEIRALRQKAGLSGSGDSASDSIAGPLVTSEIRERVRVLQDGLVILRDEHQKLIQREGDLRSRLR
ncbi:MAG: FecR domain-containing protein [Candidatus Riflebacteria bacterium]|nr:FecR domain-containing protein [Candidatus Riflebacteria bacterium]